MAADTPFDEDERRDMLEQVYRAFNDRDLDAALERMAPGVDWPNEVTGGELHGRDALRSYWQKWWSDVNPTLEPMRIHFTKDGAARVLVDELVSAKDGEILQNRRVDHVFEFDGAFISRMTIVGLEQGEVHRKQDDPDGDGDGDDGGEGEGGESGE
jgi:limonene-1,2-epoxide hydrolase